MPNMHAAPDTAYGYKYSPLLLSVAKKKSQNGTASVSSSYI
jgi:hypothetical protein